MADLPLGFSYYCQDDASVKQQIAPGTVQQRVADIYVVMTNVYEAMRVAGYKPSQWKFVVQLYPAPVPPSSDLRYPENKVSRQSIGGCGLMDKDVDWALQKFLPTVNQAILTAGHRLESQLVGNDNVLYLLTGTYWHCNDQTATTASGLDPAGEPLV